MVKAHDSTPDGNAMSRWFEHNKGLGIAIAAFVVYSIIALTVGGALFIVGDLGTAHTTTTELDGDDNVVKTTKKTEDSVPTMVIFTALAAGGWLLIPLKFTWDEFQKNRDVERRDREKEAEDARAIAAKMRDVVSDRMTSHFGPVMYRQMEIEGWARRTRESSADRKAECRSRLLYAIGKLYMLYERMRNAGVGLTLRSREQERSSSSSNRALQECLIWFVPERDEYYLANSVKAPRDQDGQFLDYSTFRDRVEQPSPGWEHLNEISVMFSAACTDGALKHLSSCAENARSGLQQGFVHVYREWYEAPGARARQGKAATNASQD